MKQRGAVDIDAVQQLMAQCMARVIQLGVECATLREQALADIDFRGPDVGTQACLQPCPFCGSATAYAEMHLRRYSVQCECGGCGPLLLTVEEAEKAWNDWAMSGQIAEERQAEKAD